MNKENLICCLKMIKEFESKNPEELREEVCSIIKEYGQTQIAKKTGVHKSILNNYVCSIRTPNFVNYVKIMTHDIDCESIPKPVSKRAEYYHKYYEDNTKPKRQEKRQESKKGDENA